MCFTKYKLLLFVILSTSVLAGPVRVGNGDNGEDLQSYTQVTSGPIFESRLQAVKLLKSFNIQRISGLGSLIPEVENTKLYLAKKALSKTQLQKLGYMANDSGQIIYARTLPEAYAATRFFRPSTKLDMNQLIALHIHEGLHRSLPVNIREDELIVTQITESITSPEASSDTINSIVANHVKKEEPYIASSTRTKKNSAVSIESRVYRENEKALVSSSSTLKNMLVFSSQFYPLELLDGQVGIGLDISSVQTQDDNYPGPMAISLSYSLQSNTQYLVEGYLKQTINSFSDEQFKDSSFARDITKVGMRYRKSEGATFIENNFAYTFRSTIDEKIEGVNHKYTFGQALSYDFHLGYKYKNFVLSGFTEILLADSFENSTINSNDKTGRISLLSWGPKIEYKLDDFSISLKARLLINSSKENSYDHVSDILDYGVGQGSVQTQINAFF